jgi:hypothetical protein
MPQASVYAQFWQEMGRESTPGLEDGPQVMVASASRNPRRQGKSLILNAPSVSSFGDVPGRRTVAWPAALLREGARPTTLVLGGFLHLAPAGAAVRAAAVLGAVAHRALPQPR